MNHFLRTSLLSCFLLAAVGRAQTCFHQGSMPQAAAVEAAPFLLGCAAAPSWPAWHLYTPAHRAPAPHFGFAPGQATARDRWIVTYRCTGWLFAPVLPDSIRRLGYVIDQPEFPCTASAH
jgi:hypothetical protein